MAGSFWRDDAEQALIQAIEAVEAESAVEVVVAVRPRSASYLAVDLAIGIAAGVATLAFVLFSPWPFSLTAMLVDPVIVGALIALAASRLPPIRRGLTPSRHRAAWVERAARASFVEHGVHHTVGRTGVFVYVSLLERAAFAVADAGVVRALGRDVWDETRAAIEAGAASGSELAAALRASAPAFAASLPRAEDDVDELPNEVRR